MKRSGSLMAIAILLFLAALAFYIRPSYASRENGQQIDPSTETIVNPAAAVAAGTVFSYQGQLTNASGNPINNASLPMTFRLFTVLTGGTACWNENQNVSVQNGQFNVLLGQITAIPSTCMSGEAYLEIVVGAETLAPREQLTSVASAVKATTLTANAQTQGPLTVTGHLVTTGDIMVQSGIIKAPAGNYSLILDNSTGGSTRMVSGEHLMFFLDADDNSSGAFLGVYRNSNHLGGNNEIVLSLSETGDMDLNGPLTVDALTVNGTVSSAGNVHANGGNVFTGPLRALHLQPENKTLHLLPFADAQYDLVCIGCGVTGRGLIVRGGLEVHGGCTQVAQREDGEIPSDVVCEAGSITSGAYVEANLMTNEERAAESLDHFERGDLLCWSAGDQQLALCVAENDRLVMAVADTNGKPIVLGAEPVKVVGPVVAGDLLVASGVPGHAMVNNNPLPGTVIGQALEDMDVASGVIKAMIRKW